jgi:hypothetical protein
MATNYSSLNAPHAGHQPYGAAGPSESTGYLAPAPPPRKRLSNWIKFGVPLLILAIVAAVVGGVLGSRHSNKSAAASSGGSNAGDPGASGSPESPAAASSAISAKKCVRLARVRWSRGADAQLVLSACLRPRRILST